MLYVHAVGLQATFAVVGPVIRLFLVDVTETYQWLNGIPVAGVFSPSRCPALELAHFHSGIAGVYVYHCITTRGAVTGPCSVRISDVLN